MSAIDELLTVREAAKRFGLGTKTIYDAIATGRLPARRFGRAYALHGTDVAALAQNIHPRRAGYMTIPEAMRRFGISRQRIHDLVRRGRLPHIHVGRRILVEIRACEARWGQTTNETDND